MKQHHPLLRRMLCAALALAVACMGTPALAKSIPALDPEMTVNSSHAIYYGSEASLADGVYGAQENVDGGGWVYVQTAADGTDNHVVFTVDLHETRTVYASGIGTIVNGWAEKMENLTLSASENGTDYTPLATFDNAELAAEWGHRHEWACPEGRAWSQRGICAMNLISRRPRSPTAPSITSAWMRSTCAPKPIRPSLRPWWTRTRATA